MLRPINAKIKTDHFTVLKKIQLSGGAEATSVTAVTVVTVAMALAAATDLLFRDDLFDGEA
jgi:hypothetical protein